jgi:hypothetical protein
MLADGWLPDFGRLGELERHLGDGRSRRSWMRRAGEGAAEEAAAAAAKTMSAHHHRHHQNRLKVRNGTPKP